jgi:hypothetical protein
MSIVVGVDCGKVNDYFAFVAAKKSSFPSAENDQIWLNKYEVRYIKRWKLLTPYPKIVDDIKKRFEISTELHGCTLVVDKTGVGEAVVDMINNAQLLADVRAYTVTNGNNPGDGTVPKKDLVYSLVSALQTRRVKVANLPLRPVLEKELEMYRMKVTASREETFSAFRESDHDDVAFALMLLTWYGELQGVEMPFTPDPNASKRTAWSDLPPGTFPTSTNW